MPSFRDTRAFTDAGEMRVWATELEEVHARRLEMDAQAPGTAGFLHEDGSWMDLDLECYMLSVEPSLDPARARVLVSCYLSQADGQ